MPDRASRDLPELLGLLFQLHPWHGLSAGPDAPAVVSVFIELVPDDTLKYEIDKASGFLKVDRPQRYSSLSPVPYGFIPRTFCAAAVAAIAERATGREGLRGDQDPLDICVLTERAINHGGVIVRARPIGGLRVFDGDDVDDKIVAVLDNDPAYSEWRELTDCPAVFVDRIHHYFQTYKDMPDAVHPRSEVADHYGAAVALEVIRAAQDDYRARYGDLERSLAEATSIRMTGRS